MDNGTGITPVMPIGGTGYGDWGGSNAFIWIFGLLILMGMFNGGMWGNNGFANAIGYENLATSNEVQRGFDNQNSMANEREILSAVNAGTAQAVAATNQTFHDTISVLSDKYSELQRDVANLAVGQANALANQSQCCCDTKMQIAEQSAGINSAIQQNRYEAALNTAAINENTTAQTQKIIDAIQGNRIADLQNQVNQLQLAQATNGMLRFPNSWTYGAGPFPPIFGCGCGCGQNV
jgi:hypothetical protein